MYLLFQLSHVAFSSRRRLASLRRRLLPRTPSLSPCDPSRTSPEREADLHPHLEPPIDDVHAPSLETPRPWPHSVSTTPMFTSRLTSWVPPNDPVFTSEVNPRTHLPLVARVFGGRKGVKIPAMGPCFGWHRRSLFHQAIAIRDRSTLRIERAHLRARTALSYVHEGVKKEGNESTCPRP